MACTSHLYSVSTSKKLIYQQTMYLNNLQSFQSPKRFVAYQLEISSKVQKTYHFGRKHCLFGRWQGGGGGSRRLKQNYQPWVVYNFLGPPNALVKVSHSQTKGRKELKIFVINLRRKKEIRLGNRCRGTTDGTGNLQK